jgi:hypothetical protein
MEEGGSQEVGGLITVERKFAAEERREIVKKTLTIRFLFAYDSRRVGPQF